MWDEDRIDAAIDEAARELTAGDPGPAFRARVMERIERAPKLSLAWRPVVVGVAVAASVATAVMVRLMPDRPYDGKPNATEVRLKPDTPYESKPPSPLRGYGGPSKPDAPFAPKDRLPASPPRGFGGLRTPVPTYVRSDAVDEIEPLTTAALDMESIAVPALDADESLRIEPLPSAPSIAVAPLAAAPEGDRR